MLTQKENKKQVAWTKEDDAWTKRKKEIMGMDQSDTEPWILDGDRHFPLKPRRRPCAIKAFLEGRIQIMCFYTLFIVA